MTALRIECWHHWRRGLRAFGLALAAAGGLAACSSTGDNTFGRLGALAKASYFGPEEPERQPEP